MTRSPLFWFALGVGAYWGFSALHRQGQHRQVSLTCYGWARGRVGGR